jgi:hypothetical protein
VSNFKERETEDIARRTKFYNEREVARLISKHGVPKTKGARVEMITAGAAESQTSEPVALTQELIDCLSYVSFVVHPQQINIRDKANGKIIAVIRR